MRAAAAAPATAPVVDRGPALLRGIGIALLVVAWALPMRVGPSAGVGPALAALLGWGLLLATVKAGRDEGARHPGIAGAAWFLALIALAGAAGWYRPEDGLVLLAAAGLFLCAACLDLSPVHAALRRALVIAALVEVAVALTQLVPSPQPGPWWLQAAPYGRIAGNLGQPNLLATLCALALAATLFRTPGPGTREAGIAAVLSFGVGLTQSRTGVLQVLLLAVALIASVGAQRTSPRPRPWRLVIVAIGGMVAGLLLSSVADTAASRAVHLQEGLGSGDISSSRFAIWRNAWTLLTMHPWAGVGWGHFSAAWTLTPFPGRPASPFDNAHLLPLHLAVELGVPAVLALTALLAWAVHQGRRFARAEQGGGDPERPWAAMALLVLLLHSLLEYPLWYPSILLPAAFWLGRWVSGGTSTSPTSPPPSAPRASLAAAAFGVMLVWGALFAAWDYARVVQAFTPFGGGLRQSLAARVAEARRSVLFGHFVDYAVTTGGAGTTPTLDDFRRPLDHLVNRKLLRAYAEALRATGDPRRAAYVLQRLKEFRDPADDARFARCQGGTPSGNDPACAAPVTTLGYDDFR